MSKGQYPPVEYLRQCFREENGKLYWLERPVEHFKSVKAMRITNTRFGGKEAGNYNKPLKRFMVHVDGYPYLRYRIIWAMHYNEWPSFIDHKNRNATDDRIENLRKCTHNQNMGNQGVRKSNTSGFKGVSWDSRTKSWEAYIHFQRKKTYLGRFCTPQEASAAYLVAAKERWGDFACTGDVLHAS